VWLFDADAGAKEVLFRRVGETKRAQSKSAKAWRCSEPEAKQTMMMLPFNTLVLNKLPIRCAG
jgi:hypothetical protein